VRAVRRAFILVASLAVLAGCGGKGSSDDEKQIKQTVTDYASALSGKNSTRLCDVLVTPKLISESKADRAAQFSRCRKRIKGQNLSGLPPAQKVEVSKVDVSGDKATAQVTTGAGGQKQSHKISFRKVDGRWRILAGS
jgi:ketosteroid isomerase-like protein